MRYKVTHRIRYVYTSPVFPEPHIFKLRPRCNASQQVYGFSMSVDPEPAGRHDFLDPEGNDATCLWFEEQITSLTVSTSFEVQTFCPNPFTYLVTDDAFFTLPVRYAILEEASLVPYLATLDRDAEVEVFARSISNQAERNTINFLSLLCTAIYEQCAVEIRHRGEPNPPDATLKNKRGACRDLAMLFIAACRCMGLAARFVSGYQEGAEESEHPHLHAWAEVYVPGGGWRGYDPTHGLVVADRHVPLAASHGPSGASPVQGTFRGTGITAEMDYLITLSVIPDNEVA